MTIELNVKLAGLKLKNPTILASGFLGVSGKLLKKVAESGAGAVTTKSIGKEQRKKFQYKKYKQINNKKNSLRSMFIKNHGKKETH
jgi:dihydroorotate dehydrogenase (NAD+) catalytic subunit